MTVTPAPTRGPSVTALALARTGVELKAFFRNRELAFFTFLLPLLLLVVLSATFEGVIVGPPGTPLVTYRQYFVAGMIATSIFSSAFVALATGVAIEQHDGLLKRLAGTPLPRASYLAGKIASVTVVAALSTALMVAIGAAFYDLRVPTEPRRLVVLAGLFALGVAACSLLGLACTRLIRNAKAGAAVVQPPFLVLLFVSGVFFVFDRVPEALQRVGALFPVKWLAQGLRYVFLPDWFSSQEAAGRWELGTVAVVLVAWTVVGFALTLRFFRWDRSGEG